MSLKYLAVITEDLGSETCYVSFVKRIAQDGALVGVPVVSSRSTAFTVGTPTLNSTTMVVNGVSHAANSLLTFVVTAADDTAGLIGEIAVAYQTPLSDGTEVFHVKRSAPPEPITDATSAYIKGDDGRSAYEVAVAAGFVGSESDWISSLSGPLTVVESLTATVDGLTTGVIDSDTTFAEITSSDATYLVTLPTTTLDKVIRGRCALIGCVVRSGVGSSDTINSLAADGMGGVMLNAGSRFVAECFELGNWIVTTYDDEGVLVDEVVKRYVATTGSDSNDGSLATPWLTVGKAKTEVATLLAADSQRHITVYIYGGTYEVTSTLSFGTADCSDTHMVTYQAVEGETPILSALKTLSPSWSVHAGSVQKATLASQADFSQLVVNGRVATRARWPKAGSYHVMPTFTATSEDGHTFADYFEYDTDVGDPSATLDLANNKVEVITYHGFAVDRHIVESVDAANGDLITQEETYWDSQIPNAGFTWQRYYGRYYYEGSKEFITAEDEFHFDSVTDILYYYPVTGETIGSSVFQVAQINTIVEVLGNSDLDRARNLKFSGITFVGTDRDTLTTMWSDPGQSYRTQLPPAVKFQYAESCTLDSCTIKDCAGGGFWAYICDKIVVTDNTIHDLGYSGITMEGQVKGWGAPPTWDEHTISGNEIYNIGQTTHNSGGITLITTANSTVTNNYIHDVPYCGILCYYGLDIKDRGFANLNITYNTLANCMNELEDGGAIYGNGYVPGGNISYNNIQDNVRTSLHEFPRAGEPDHPGEIFGIYIDPGGAWSITNNLVNRYATSGVMLHDSGLNTTVSNNIFIDPEESGRSSAVTMNLSRKIGADGPNQYSLPITAMKNNIYYSTTGQPAVRYFRALASGSPSEIQEISELGGYGDIDLNLYSHDKVWVRTDHDNVGYETDIGFMRHQIYPLAEPYPLDGGMDSEDNSVVDPDPKFTSFYDDDFTVLAGSPALTLGFTNFTVPAIAHKPYTTSTMASAANFRAIDTDYTGWENDLFDRIGEYYYNCPIARTNTYYFSPSGDDGSDGLTTATAKQTIGEVQVLIDAQPQDADIEIALECDGVFDSTTGIVTTKDNVTIRSYGYGEKPIINAFSQKYTTGWSNVPGTNRWTIAETNDIAWLRFQTNRLGSLLTLTEDIAGCEATESSFFWGANVLHVNLGVTNPNVVALEGVISNQLSGVEFGGTGCRAENVRADGWGMDRADRVTQKQPFTSENAGDDCNLFVQCEGYYSGSHAMAQHSSDGGGGGRSCWVDCIAGYCMWNNTALTPPRAAETVFNSYAQFGGHETLFIRCTAKYGTLPSWEIVDDDEYGTTGFYAHTSSSDCDLMVCYKCKTEASGTPCVGLGGFANLPAPTGFDITTCRGFIVKCEHPYNSVTKTLGMPSTGGTVSYGNQFFFKPSAEDGQLVTTGGRIWYINDNYEADVAARHTAALQWFWANATDTWDPQIYHSRFHCTNVTVNIATRGGMNAANRTLNGDPAVQASKNATGMAVNSIFSTDSATDVTFIFAFQNLAAYIDSNAFYGYNEIATYANQTRGWDNDANLVTLTTLPLYGVSHDQLLNTGGTVKTVSHDAAGKARTGLPDIGPIDFS